MKTRILYLGLVFLVLGLSTYSFAVAAHLQEYACSPTCSLIINGTSTRSVCGGYCPYIGIPGSPVQAGGILLAVVGAIFLVVGLSNLFLSGVENRLAGK
jgi:hypothetical protein